MGEGAQKTYGRIKSDSSSAIRPWGIVIIFPTDARKHVFVPRLLRWSLGSLKIRYIRRNGGPF